MAGNARAIGKHVLEPSISAATRPLSSSDAGSYAPRQRDRVSVGCDQRQGRGNRLFAYSPYMKLLSEGTEPSIRGAIGNRNALDTENTVERAL